MSTIFTHTKSLLTRAYFEPLFTPENVWKSPTSFEEALVRIHCRICILEYVFLDKAGLKSFRVLCRLGSTVNGTGNIKIYSSFSSL